MKYRAIYEPHVEMWLIQRQTLLIFWTNINAAFTEDEAKELLEKYKNPQPTKILE
jgi:hypothetical protein